MRNGSVHLELLFLPLLVLTSYQQLPYVGILCKAKVFFCLWRWLDYLTIYFYFKSVIFLKLSICCLVPNRTTFVMPSLNFNLFIFIHLCISVIHASRESLHFASDLVLLGLKDR